MVCFFKIQSTLIYYDTDHYLLVVAKVRDSK